MSGNGRTAVQANAALEIRNPGFLDQRTLRNGGTVRWTAGNFDLKNGGKIEDYGRFEVAHDARIRRIFGQAGTFSNEAAGTFVKAGGTGETRFDEVLLNNRGTVEVNSGTVTLAGGGTASGTFTMAANTVLNFASDYTLTSGANLNGPGVARLAAGTLTITGNVSAEGFEMPAGVLSGTGTLTVSRLFQWNGGTLSGTGTTRVTGTLEITGAGVKVLDRRTLANAGTTGFWTDAGQLRAKNGSRFSNEAGAVFEARSDALYL